MAITGTAVQTNIAAQANSTANDKNTDPVIENPKAEKESEVVADFSPLRDRDHIDGERLKASYDTLRSGNCTKLIMCTTKNHDFSIRDGSDPKAYPAAHIAVKDFFVEFMKLSKTKALDNLRTIQIEDTYIENFSLPDGFFEVIALLPKLREATFARSPLRASHFLTLMTSTSIEKLEILAIKFGIGLNFSKLQKLISASKIKDLTLYNCEITDPTLEVLSESSTLTTLDLTYNERCTERGFRALANSQSICSLIVGRTTLHNKEAILTYAQTMESEKKNIHDKTVADFSPINDREYFVRNMQMAAKVALKSGQCTQFIVSFSSLGDADSEVYNAAAESVRGTFKTFLTLSKSKALNNIHTIRVEDWHQITDDFFEVIALLPKLRSVSFRCTNMSHKQFLTILRNPVIEELNIVAIQEVGMNVDLETLKKRVQSSNIKEWCLYNCHITDPFLEVLSHSRSLNKLNLTHNQTFTSAGLKELTRNSSINDITLGCTAQDAEGTLALIESNQLESFNDPIGEYTVNSDGACHYERRRFTKEEYERMDNAFEDNTSILRAGICMRELRWPSTFPCRAFCAPINENERLDSIPIEKDINWTRFIDAYAYAPRNRALVKVFVHFNDVVRTEVERWNAETIDVSRPASIIHAYARPTIKEFEAVFSEERAKELFPFELPILRQYGLYKKANVSQTGSHTNDSKPSVAAVSASHTASAATSASTVPSVMYRCGHHRN